MTFFFSGLKHQQIDVLRQLGPITRKHRFYLAGGTALSIYFGHRVSIDLDWFTQNEMGDALLLAENLRRANLDFITEQTAPGTLHGNIADIRVSFLEFRYPLLQPLTDWTEMGCTIASLDDLACMKLSAIAQRGARKDFCDIYALGAKHRPLREMFAIYQQKFNVKDISPILYGLAYFDDAESERMPSMLWDISWKEIKKTISAWVKEAGKV
jgi:predicted nucleotidyltransferase component of viral defense system